MIARPRTSAPQLLRRGVVALLVAATLALSGCGIPVEDAPRALPTEGAGSTASPPATTPPTPSEDQATLWFVREGQLVAVSRTAQGALDPQEFIDLLVAGPTEQEKAAGIRSAVVSVVTGEPLVVTADSANVSTPDQPDGRVAVVLRPEFRELISEEQVLILGEVVTTVAVGDVKEVLFVNEDGQQLGVPVADGRLRNGPVTPLDYASLVAG